MRTSLGNYIDVGVPGLASFDFASSILFLQEVMLWWNSHRIRANRQHEQVTGIPDILYFAPETVSPHVESFICGVSGAQLNEARLLAKVSNSLSGDSDLDDYLSSIMDRLYLQFPKTWQDGVRLYLQLKDMAYNGTQISSNG